MPTIPISFGISGDTVTAVSVTSLLRSDTGADAGVSLPIALTLTSGAWTGSFSDASPPAYYTAVISITYSDSSVQSAGGLTIRGASSGVYCSISDVNAEMGAFNEQQAADPDNQANATQISIHEQSALDFADNYINARLSAANFATPATVNLGMLKIVAAKLAAYQLYQVRGLQDKKNAFAEKMEWAKEELDELLWMNRGGFTRASGYSDAPIAVGATVNSDGRPIRTLVCTPYFDGYCWRY